MLDKSAPDQTKRRTLKFAIGVPLVILGLVLTVAWSGFLISMAADLLMRLFR